MPKSHEEIADKAREIFKKARTSRVPITIVCTQAVTLFGLEKWELEDIKQVSGDVINMLILNGWKTGSAESGLHSNFGHGATNHGSR